MQAREWKARDVKEAFFPVELRPVYMPSPKLAQGYHPLDRHFAVVDVEHDRAFSVVTDDYQLVTNQEAYERAAEVMQKVFQVTKLNDLECLNITMPQTRSFCHIDLIHGEADFSPFERDQWTAFLRITNSYNRTRKLHFELGFCRWICLNGMIFGAKSIEFSYAHTRRGIDRSMRFQNNIGDIRKLETQLTEQLHQLKRYHVPETEMLPLVCRAFDVRVSEDLDAESKRADELRTFREQIRELTQRYFGDMGAHGYAALNVLTDFASRPVGVMAPETRIHAFQQRASAWMEDFVQAIQRREFSFDAYLGEYRDVASRLEGL